MSYYHYGMFVQITKAGLDGLVNERDTLAQQVAQLEKERDFYECSSSCANDEVNHLKQQVAGLREALEYIVNDYERQYGPRPPSRG